MNSTAPAPVSAVAVLPIDATAVRRLIAQGTVRYVVQGVTLDLEFERHETPPWLMPPWLMPYGGNARYVRRVDLDAAVGLSADLIGPDPMGHVHLYDRAAATLDLKQYHLRARRLGQLSDDIDIDKEVARLIDEELADLRDWCAGRWFKASITLRVTCPITANWPIPDRDVGRIDVFEPTADVAPDSAEIRMCDTLADRLNANVETMLRAMALTDRHKSLENLPFGPLWTGVLGSGAPDDGCLYWYDGPLIWLSNDDRGDYWLTVIMDDDYNAKIMTHLVFPISDNSAVKLKSDSANILDLIKDLHDLCADRTMFLPSAHRGWVVRQNYQSAVIDYRPATVDDFRVVMPKVTPEEETSPRTNVHGEIVQGEIGPGEIGPG